MKHASCYLHYLGAIYAGFAAYNHGIFRFIAKKYICITFTAIRYAGWVSKGKISVLAQIWTRVFVLGNLCFPGFPCNVRIRFCFQTMSVSYVFTESRCMKWIYYKRLVTQSFSAPVHQLLVFMSLFHYLNISHAHPIYARTVPGNQIDNTWNLRWKCVMGSDQNAFWKLPVQRHQHLTSETG